MQPKLAANKDIFAIEMRNVEEVFESTGKCLCEKIQFTVNGSLGEVRYCHCSQCRRVSGTAFSANAKVSIDSWNIVLGKNSITEYEHKPGIFRAFCSNCGSPIYSKLESDPENIRVRLGSFENVKDVTVTGHVWIASKAIWYEIEDSLPCFLESIEE